MRGTALYSHPPVDEVCPANRLASVLNLGGRQRYERNVSKIQRDFRCHGARRDVVRAAERGQKVIERVLVGDVDGGEVDVGLVALLVEDVVLAKRGIEEVARRNALRVLVVVLLVGTGNLN